MSPKFYKLVETFEMLNPSNLVTRAAIAQLQNWETFGIIKGLVWKLDEIFPTRGGLESFSV